MIMEGDTEVRVDENIVDNDEEDDPNVPSTSSAKKPVKRKSFDLSFKLTVVEHSEKHGIHDASKVFKIDRSNIRRWKQKKDVMKTDMEKEQQPLKRVLGAGRKPLLGEIEEELMKWFETERGLNHKVTRTDLQHRALNLYREHNPTMSTVELQSFKASRGWLFTFMDRHKIVLRRRTTVCQKAPAEVIPKLVDFVLYIRQQRAKRQYPYGSIYASDETTVWLDNPGDTTVSAKGVREVQICSTGHEKMNVTVLLTAKADGTKCKPFVVLPRKRPIPELEKEFSDSITIAYSQSAKSWMDDDLTKQYLRRVIGTFAFGDRLLVWDSFRCHISESTKAVMKDLRIQSAVVPGGCTGKIQPADVVWNKPFKDHFRGLYLEWIREGDKSYTSGNRMRAPDWKLVCRWIKESWESLSIDLVKKSFKCCGITVAEDGSEDSEISCFKDGRGLEEGKQLLERKMAEVADQEEPEEIPVDELFGDDDSDTASVVSVNL